jgi:hypothetical protein
MGKKSKRRKSRSGKKFSRHISFDFYELDGFDLTVRIRQGSRKSSRRKNHHNGRRRIVRNKQPRHLFTWIDFKKARGGDWWGFHYSKQHPSKYGSVVPVLDIHRKNRTWNMTVSFHGNRVLEKLQEWKKEGYRFAFFIHGKSRRGGWKTFLKFHTGFRCEEYREADNCCHPYVTVVILN